jgi:hypothetical protein
MAMFRTPAVTYTDTAVFEPVEQGVFHHRPSGLYRVGLTMVLETDEEVHEVIRDVMSSCRVNVVHHTIEKTADGGQQVDLELEACGPSPTRNLKNARFIASLPGCRGRPRRDDQGNLWLVLEPTEADEERTVPLGRNPTYLNSPSDPWTGEDPVYPAPSPHPDRGGR